VTAGGVRPRRAGIVGAGMISEHHIAALEGLVDVELVGIYDTDPSRAEARAALSSTTAYGSLDALVEAGVDVIHVLTPPSTHAQVALAALDRGCHVLVEKPLAESPDDARQIGERAAAKGLVASVGHSLLYDPQVLAALEQVRIGALGEVVGVDISRNSDYPPYEGGPLPPHMRQAAYPWRDLGIHCLYLAQELLGPIVDVDVHWLSLGGDRNLVFDEWRGVVRCERGFCQLRLSWNAKPPESQVVIHGSRGSMRVDLFAMYRSRRRATPMPKAIERVTNAYAESLRPLAEVPVNAWRFLRKEIQPYQAVRNLVADFYVRLAAGRPPRVSVEDAAVLVEWLEVVARAADDEHAGAAERFRVSPTTEFLVTGASGALGSAVVRRLLGEGRTVRAFVRQIPSRPVEGVEYRFGNLGDPDAVARAVEGAEVVIHAGAAKAGGWPEHYGATVVGTRNVIGACRRFGVRQLVHVSSMSVVDWTGAGSGEPISEATPLEPRAEERGAYTRAKLEAELAVSAAARDGLPSVILRPGVIFGAGLPLVSPAVARLAGDRWVVLGSGRLTVPLVYIDDVVDAVLAAVGRELVSGEVIQIIDDERLTQEEILGLSDTHRAVIRIPRVAALAAGRLSEYPLGWLGRQSPIGAYRLRSALAEASFESDRAERLLGWGPRVGVREGIRRVTGDPTRGGRQFVSPQPCNRGASK
jgi:2-alkyl-3-oxoalkanoate reductase